MSLPPLGMQKEWPYGGSAPAVRGRSSGSLYLLDVWWKGLSSGGSWQEKANLLVLSASTGHTEERPSGDGTQWTEADLLALSA